MSVMTINVDIANDAAIERILRTEEPAYIYIRLSRDGNNPEFIITGPDSDKPSDSILVGIMRAMFNTYTNGYSYYYERTDFLPHESVF